MVHESVKGKSELRAGQFQGLRFHGRFDRPANTKVIDFPFWFLRKCIDLTLIYERHAPQSTSCGIFFDTPCHYLCLSSSIDSHHCVVVV